jgi:DNA-binding NarL/FixJ family response regulator
MPIRVLLADDHQILREALRMLLRAQADIELVAEADHGRDAIRLAAELEPDVVVMDVMMPGVDGIAAARRIAAEHPGTRVVSLSANADRTVVADCLRAGAVAFLPKDAAFDELAAAIRAAHAGETYVSPRLGRFSAHAPAPLSPRERDILVRLANGLATKEIAADLSVSIKTVETHRRALMEKLQLFSVAELTKYALQQGLTQPWQHS